MYTISDFYNTYKGQITLIAGAGGLSHPVSIAGFLDYELVPELKSKYFNSNFIKDQLLLTSFLYAKESPHQMLDAIKHIISKGCSGLVIRNVFHLPISDVVIRYANSKNFPIFLIESREIFFEDIVYQIKKHQEILNSFDKENKIMNRIIKSNLSKEELKEAAFQLNPSFREQFFCSFCRLTDKFLLDDLNALYEKYNGSKYDNSKNTLVFGNNGIFFICSGYDIADLCTSDYISDLYDLLLEKESEKEIGISDMHNSLSDLKNAITESIYASLYCRISENDISNYDDLESYKIIFPYANDDLMLSFSKSLLEPLIEFDTYYNYDFYKTLETYINSGNNIHKTAKLTGLHEQSIRYRLNKIYSLTNTNSKSATSLEQLSLAVKIQKTKELLNHF